MYLRQELVKEEFKCKSLKKIISQKMNINKINVIPLTKNYLHIKKEIN
jgi:hypothetical protein